MAFDQSTRNFLQRTVTKCREILAGRWQAPTEGEFFRQLQEIYGISPDGVTAPMEVLAHLGDEDRETARVLRDTIDHYAAGLKASGKAEKEARREAVMRVAREQAFTVLNRLAALRMAEERGIVLECVRKGTQSEGFQLFLQSAGNAYGSTSAAYRVYLQVIFDELARDLGVLFNRFDKSSLLFPRHEALEALLKELSGTGEANRNASYTPEQVASFWGEDETIGWIYQYYNDPAERKKMREESAAPRNSRELAVRNQFFTPRYVVEFLTDNTLGRIWYEMTRGQTRLAEQCRYLVRRPTEIFLAEGETAPETPDQEGLSQEELLKQPVYIPHRPLKDPREIRLLDPACGSMHFGLYAYDIFEAIYEEAWDKGFCPTLQEAYPSKGEFLKDVPRLIIENNLHGIDIDPRATQIAALSLWLRAQKTWQQQKVTAGDRPRVRRSNIVCAEPMPGSPKMLEDFVATLDPPLLGELVKTVFDKMQLAGEAGSLLKIEEEIRTAIDSTRKEWLKQQDDLLARKDGSQEEFFDTAEQQVIDALRAYAEQADADSYQRRLFADDAARGFAFIDLCRKGFDVAVMNPPFGEASPLGAQYMHKHFRESRHDFAAAMFTRTEQLLNSLGRIGILSAANVWFSSYLRNWRSYLLLEKTEIAAAAHLGGHVLDGATIRTVSWVGSKSSYNLGSAAFFRLVFASEKEQELLHSVEQLRCGNASSSLRLTDPNDFKSIDLRPIAYWGTKRLFSLFLSCPSFEPTYGLSRVGLQTNDDERVLRLWQEVPPSTLGSNNIWVPYAKGGEFSPYHGDIHLVVLWADSAREMKAMEAARVDAGANSRGNSALGTHEFFLRPGITYTERTNKPFAPRVLPGGCIFATSGPAILHHSPDAIPELWLLGLFNSRFSRFFLGLSLGSSEASGGEGASHYKVGLVKLLPVSEPEANLRKEINKLVSKAIGNRAELQFNDSSCNLWVCPNLSQFFSLKDLVSARSKRALDRDIEFIDLESQINKSIELNYHLTAEERDAFSCELGEALTLDQGFSDPEADPNRGQTLIEKKVIADLGSIRSAIESGVAAKWYFEEEQLATLPEVVEILTGTAFGRWDIRYATGERQPPELRDPFDPLPVCPPGMLQNAEGLPAEPKDLPAGYPLRIFWPGILVDDQNHPEDIVARVREAIEVIWKDRAEAIEQEACGILGVKILRDYFRRPAAFFADHLKRYSKSRRQAPIYWPLSTNSGSYTLWLYYHRLTPDTLYKCIQQFVEPKMKDVEQTILRLRTMSAANEGGSKERKQLEEAESLLDELKELHAELSLWAPKWKPNLNDGVLLTACPLWRLFRLPKWRKDLEACWKQLARGDYDWAHLAYTLFPDRVREKCKTDRSIAIAHGLEGLCQVQAPAPKTKRAKKQKQPSSEDALL